MRRRIRWMVVTIAALGAACCSGCSGPAEIDAQGAGRSAAYEPGVPNFDLEAVARFRDTAPGVEVYVSFPRTALVFTAGDSAFAARYDLSLRVKDASGRETIDFVSFGDTLRVPTVEATRSYDRVRHEARFALAPGTYLVEGTLEDPETGAVALRRQRVEVTDGTEPQLSAPLVFRGEQGAPLVALHVSSEVALWAEVDVVRPPADAVLDVTLAELRADTTVARPPFWLAPSQGSLVYRGLDEDAADTLLTEQRAVAGSTVATERAALPPLQPGVYRLAFALRRGAEVLDRRERILSVKGPGYPRLSTLAELIDALAYIAYDREVEAIEAGATPEERRRRFDAFWGSLVDDRRVAANLLRLYYERVEEANLLFTSVKEGWKTDRGMIHVVFGTPEYVEETFEGQTWHYGYGASGTAQAFVFERSRFYREEDPFERYYLVRQPGYEQAWRRAIRQWRRGEAL